MITSIAKFPTPGRTSNTSWTTPTRMASSSIFSGAFRRSATTVENPSATGTATISSRPASYMPETIDMPESPRRKTAQKTSTPVGCLRMKS